MRCVGWRSALTNTDSRGSDWLSAWRWLKDARSTLCKGDVLYASLERSKDVGIVGGRAAMPEVFEEWKSP